MSCYSVQTRFKEYTISASKNCICLEIKRDTAPAHQNWTMLTSICASTPSLHLCNLGNLNHFPPIHPFLPPPPSPTLPLPLFLASPPGHNSFDPYYYFWTKKSRFRAWISKYLTYLRTKNKIKRLSVWWRESSLVIVQTRHRGNSVSAGTSLPYPPILLLSHSSSLVYCTPRLSPLPYTL